MSNWLSLAAGLNNAVVAVFGEEDAIPVIYQRGPVSATINGIFSTRGQDDLAVGEVMQFFVTVADIEASEIADSPQNGDQVTIRGVLYDVYQPLFDAAGGCTMTIKQAN